MLGYSPPNVCSIGICQNVLTLVRCSTYRNDCDGFCCDEGYITKPDNKQQRPNLRLTVKSYKNLFR